MDGGVIMINKIKGFDSVVTQQLNAIYSKIEAKDKVIQNKIQLKNCLHITAEEPSVRMSHKNILEELMDKICEQKLIDIDTFQELLDEIMEDEPYHYNVEEKT